MVIVPFTFIRSTAFKERVELADKLNEVIAVLNQYPVTITDITMTTNNGTFTTTFYMSDGSTKSYTYTLEDYVTNSALATILSDYATKFYVDGKDEQNVKLTGAQSINGVKTFNDSPIVPNDPSMYGAVNNAYVNDSTDGVNNIVHKSGTETISGTKYFTSSLIKKSSIAIDQPVTTYTNFGDIYIQDKDNLQVVDIRRDKLATDNDRCFMMLTAKHGDDTYNVRLDIALTPTNEAVLSVSKVKNGSNVESYEVWRSTL